MNLGRNNSIQHEACQIEEGLSLETMDLTDKVEYWPITEVAVCMRMSRHLDLFWYPHGFTKVDLLGFFSFLA